MNTFSYMQPSRSCSRKASIQHVVVVKHMGLLAYVSSALHLNALPGRADEVAYLELVDLGGAPPYEEVKANV